MTIGQNTRQRGSKDSFNIMTGQQQSVSHAVKYDIDAICQPYTHMSLYHVTYLN